MGVRRTWIGAAVCGAVILAALLIAPWGVARHSCSTFLLPAGQSLYVGHNLDEYFEVPGLVVVNKKGAAKENVSWADVISLTGREEEAPRLRWVSKFGSITYNTFGREFPDGGMNEAGLYVGEMTLKGTVWPTDDLPKIHHHQWMQYLLDNFKSVDEAVASLKVLSPSGHTEWHFFLADRRGNTAVIEFDQGRAVIYQGENIPVKVLCNAAYGAELEKMRRFKGYGGSEDPGREAKNADNRFVWATSLIAAYAASGSADPAAYVFRTLEALKLGNNQWSIVYDLTRGRMYFTTVKARRVRYVDFSRFDFSCAGPSLCLDITRDLEGDVSAAFEPLTEALNEEYIRRALEPIDAGQAGNRFKPLWKKRLSDSIKPFACAP
jgi:choloylglycine hydrolase